MTTRWRIEPLADHPDCIPELAGWFEQAWPAWYAGIAAGRAGADLRSYAQRGALPIGLMALTPGGGPCGFGALKREAFPTHPHLAPWAGALCVAPALRRQGIGRALLIGLEAEARQLGHARLYAATGSARLLFERLGWSVLEQVRHDGQSLAILTKAI